MIASAPGKLFVAGEHAVTEPGEPAVLIAVDRRLELELTPRLEREPSRLEREGRYVRAVAAVVAELARARGRGHAEPFAVTSRSTLVDPAVGGAPARKYGLGSSAAVTVAAARALDAWYGLGLSDPEVLRVALLATVRVNPAASGADVATSLLGGWVAYSSPDRAWLSGRDSGHDGVAHLVATDWPGLACARLATPASVDVRVGWTGSPASTVSIVAAVRAAGIPEAFLAASRAAVREATTAIGDDDVTGVRHAVGNVRRALRDLGERVGVAIETPLLTALADAAERHGYAGKSSGAGGGDCGIALGPAGDPHAGDALEADWSAIGITPLHIAVAPGAWVEEQE